MLSNISIEHVLFAIFSTLTPYFSNQNLILALLVMPESARPIRNCAFRLTRFVSTASRKNFCSATKSLVRRKTVPALLLATKLWERVIRLLSGGWTGSVGQCVTWSTWSKNWKRGVSAFVRFPMGWLTPHPHPASWFSTYSPHLPSLNEGWFRKERKQDWPQREPVVELAVVP